MRGSACRITKAREVGMGGCLPDFSADTLGSPRARFIPEAHERIWLGGILLHGRQLQFSGESVQIASAGQILTIGISGGQLQQTVEGKAGGDSSVRWPPRVDGRVNRDWRRCHSGLGRARFIGKWIRLTVRVMLSSLSRQGQYGLSRTVAFARHAGWILYLWLCLCVRKAPEARRHDVHVLQRSWRAGRQTAICARRRRIQVGWIEVFKFGASFKAKRRRSCLLDEDCVGQGGEATRFHDGKHAHMRVGGRCVKDALHSLSSCAVEPHTWWCSRCRAHLKNSLPSHLRDTEHA